MAQPKAINNEALPENRRRVPRRPINKRIGLLVRGQYFVCMGYEIGEGGMLIDSVSPLTEGQKVVITIRVPGAIHATALGKVVYISQPINSTDPVKYGIQFENIGFDIKRKIRNFVASNTSSMNAA